MKIIGMIGGMSWESSAEYYRIINQTVRAKQGGLHSARSLMYSVDFSKVEQLQRAGRWDRAAELLADAARSLERAGTDFFLICTNTMHFVADEVQAATRLPLLHIADATAETILQSGQKCVGLLGTRFTMEMEFYRERLSGRGLEILTPESGDREFVHHVIYEELCRGIVSDHSREQFSVIIGKLQEQGAEGVILGCTEIGLLIRQKDFDLPVYDTTRIHAETAALISIGELEPDWADAGS